MIPVAPLESFEKEDPLEPSSGVGCKMQANGWPGGTAEGQHAEDSCGEVVLLALLTLHWPAEMQAAPGSLSLGYMSN